jgi:hypothetical protein
VAATSNRDFELTELFTAFDQLEDPGASINRLHPLCSVLSIAVPAVLCGADGPTSIGTGLRPGRSSWNDLLNCQMVSHLEMFSGEFSVPCNQPHSSSVSVSGFSR